MKVIRLLCGFCFLLLLPFSSSAQFEWNTNFPCLKCPPSDGTIDIPPPNCSLNWSVSGLTPIGYSYFKGSGTAKTAVGRLTQGVNGWVNFVVDHSDQLNPYPSVSTYTMNLNLGGTDYRIVYQTPQVNIINKFFLGYPSANRAYVQQCGNIEIYVGKNRIYNNTYMVCPPPPIWNPRNLKPFQTPVPVDMILNKSVFRIAREGSEVKFYADNKLLVTSSNADTGSGRIILQAVNGKKIRATIFSPFCQLITTEFDVLPLDCTVPTFNQLQAVQVIGGDAPYTHYNHNVFSSLPEVNPISSSTPTVGWTTLVDASNRAATYYMGVGVGIDWQHVGTQLNNNVLSNFFALGALGASTGSNVLSSGTNGWLGFRKESATGWSVGFVDAITSSSLYEFRAINPRTSSIYISGSPVATVQALLTDYLRISKEGSSVKFYVNEVEVYSQSLLSSVDLQAKFGFTQTGATISYPTLSFCTPIDPPVVTLASTDLSACQYEDIPLITPTTQNVTELRWYTTNPDGVSPRPSYVSGFSFDPDGINTGSLGVGTHSYYVTGVDLNGDETASQEITLTIHPLPNLQIYNYGNTFCPGTTLHLQASSQASTSSYKWFNNGVIMTGEVDRNLYITEGGLYKVEVLTAEGCIISSEENIIQQSPPVVSLTYVNSSSGCGQVALEAIGGSTNTRYVYQKKTSPTTWSNSGYSSSTSYITTFSGTYRVYYTDVISGCTAFSNEVDVVVNALPQNAITAPSPICQNEDITLQVQNYNSSYNYEWEQLEGSTWVSRGSNQSLFVPYVVSVISTRFRLHVINPSTGCSKIFYRNLIYTPFPTITYTSFIEAEIGDPVDFDVVGSVNYTYQWTYPNGSISATAPITVNPTSYGEYTLVVSNGTCQTTYRAIIAEKGVFATLKENLDASYYHTNKEGKLYFKFDEKYGLGTTGLASVSVFNYDFQEVGQTSLGKTYGYNWYELDLSSFDCIEGDYYVLHIRDELERRYVLRVKYVTGANKVIISDDSNICISNNTDLRSIRLDAKSYVDSSPYSIKWYTSTVQNDIVELETNTNRENLLFDEKSNLNNQPSSTYFETQQNYSNVNSIYAPGANMYYVRAMITDFCGNVAYSDVITVNIYIGTGCRIAANEIVSKKKHRFEFFFSIRRLLSPTKPTNSTTR